MEFNLNDIFKNAFGYDAPSGKFSLSDAPAREENSSLGQPYYKEDLSGREFFLPVTINDYLIPFAVMGMTWKKTYVSTAMPERGGSVRELISLDDYVFNIKGILVRDNNTYPESEIIDLHNIFLINANVKLRSVLSDIVLKGEFEHNVIIKDVKWPAVAGVQHAKPFELEVESDMIFTLTID